MTNERLEELRALAADPRWGCSNHVAELLADVDRLRAEVNRLFDMADNQAAEIRLLRDNFDPRLLAKEVELNRLRVAVGAVRALKPCAMVTTSYLVGASMEHDDDGDWLYRDDVLAALEATDGD